MNSLRAKRNLKLSVPAKKIAIVIVSNGFIAVAKQRRKCLIFHSPVWQRVGFRDCKCHRKCRYTFHLKNLARCRLKCFGGSAAQFKHPKLSFSLRSAVKESVQWRAESIFIYPDFILNLKFSRPGKSHVKVLISLLSVVQNG